MNKLPQENPLSATIKILILEDNPDDVKLITRELKRAGWDFELICTDQETEYIAALQNPPGVILTDYHMPSFGAPQALKLLRQHGLDIPFIVVSGSVGEDLAVEMIKQGADDYLLKDRLGRLGQAVAQAIEANRLRQRDKILSAILDADLLGIVSWDNHGIIREANDCFLRIIGHDRQALEAGQLDLRILTPRDYAELDAKADAQLIVGSKCVPYEKEYFHKDNSRVPVLIGSACWNKSIEKGVAFVLDLSEKKHAESANFHLAAIVDCSEDAIIGESLDGHILGWNPGAERMYGYREVEIIGKPASLLIPPEEIAASQKYIARVGNGERISSFETLRKHKNGEIFPVALTLSPVFDKQNHVIAVASIAHDITKQKKLEEQFRQAQKMEAIGQLAGGVAHDFNNILTIISGCSDLILARAALGTDDQAMLKEIKKASTKATALTRQLLAFSRRSILEIRTFAINMIVQDSEKMLRRLVGEDVEFVTNLDSAAGSVNTDSGQLEQALMNLAVNARDAMPNGGKLTITTAAVKLTKADCSNRIDVQPGDYAMVSIADTGVGMDEKTVTHIFEPFFTTKELGKGTGLGLAMVHGFVKQSGGHIVVESKPGQGTRFSLYLPRLETKSNEVKIKSGLYTMPGGNETILLIEDDKDVRTLVYHVLLGKGYTVLEASNGSDAMAVAERHEHPIHLLITDVVMPKMGGWEVAQKITALRPGIKVLFMSGYTDDAILRHGIHKAEVNFLQKPYTSLALALKVRNVLDSRDKIVAQ